MAKKKPAWKRDPFNTFRYEKRPAVWNGIPGTVIDTFFKLVLFYSPATLDRHIVREWLPFDEPTLKIEMHGRPREHVNQAEKQRAYRERKKGNALRKYSKSDKGVIQE